MTEMKFVLQKNQNSKKKEKEEELKQRSANSFHDGTLRF